MQATKYIWQNGKLVPWEQAQTHVLSHGLHYGAGAFEGMRTYLTEKGPAVFRLDDHLKRLFHSANVVRLKIPYTFEELHNATINLLRENQIEQCYIRPLVSYGYLKLGVNPHGNPVDTIIACWRWDSYLAHKHVDIITSKYARIAPNATIPTAKLSGQYLNSMLGLIEIHGTKYHETLFLDSEGNVAEGSSENIFIIKDNTIYTPKLGSILPGITRDTVIKIAQKLGFNIIEKDIKLEEAYTADEAFFTGTAAEVTAIKSIDDKIIGNGEIGPITKLLDKTYLDVVYGRNQDFAEYLTYLD
jgi:branched-chain amino acid aminotransferase